MRLGVSFRTWAVARLLIARSAHSLLDHVHRLYPVELTEFVDDVTHKVEGTGASVLRVFPRSVEYVAREIRALGLTVSLKSGMVASSRDFGRLLLNTLAESDVRMGLQDHIRDLGLDAYTGRRPRKRIALRRRHRAALRAGKVSTYARATLRGDGFLLVGSTRSRCMACSSLGSLRRRCILFEGRQRERAPRSVKADVSRHCSPWRWGSMIRRGRSLETCWSSGSTSGSISQRHNAKECTVSWDLAKPRIVSATRRQRWHGVKGPLTATIATLCELQWDPQGPVLWTTVYGDQLSLVADGAAADCRHLRREISAAIDQQLWTQAAQHEQGEGLQRGVDLYATRLHLARLRKRGQHKEAYFLMACLTGALWPLQRQHDCPRSGETPIDPTCKRCEEGCVETFLHRHWLCAGNLFDHPNEAPGTFSSSPSGGSGHALSVASGPPTS